MWLLVVVVHGLHYVLLANLDDVAAVEVALMSLHLVVVFQVVLQVVSPSWVVSPGSHPGSFSILGSISR